MSIDEAIRILERLQDPDPTEGTLTVEAWSAIDMAIDSLKRDDQTLKPCPLCGGAAHLVFDRHAQLPWVVMCNRDSCGCNIFARERPEQAIRVWNKRKGE